MQSPSPRLWVVATPLGNPGDLSPRAREILQSVDLVLAEDTRRAGLLCQRCGIHAQRFMSLHEHNEEQQCASLVQQFQQGCTAALISDAGTPLMADPGYRLVRACRAAGVEVSMAPGPSAPVAALMAAGLPPQPYVFLGFAPKDTSAREKFFAPYTDLALTLVFFERKDRLHATLQVAYQLLGSRELAVARELTKTHEQFIITRLEEYAALPQDLLGEITVVIGPPEQQERTPLEKVRACIAEECALGGKGRDIVRRVQARTKGWTSKELYQLTAGHTQ